MQASVLGLWAVSEYTKKVECNSVVFQTKPLLLKDNFIHENGDRMTSSAHLDDFKNKVLMLRKNQEAVVARKYYGFQ